MPDSPYPLLIPAVAWSAIVAQFVFHFFKLPNQLFNEIVRSGAKGLAISNIESTELLPTIARLINNVVTRKANKERLGLTATYEDVLQEVEFKDDIEHAQEAISSVNKLELDYKELVEIASWAWKPAAFHIPAVLGCVSIYVFFSAGNIRNSACVLLAIVALLTIVRAMEAMIMFDRKRSALMATLNEYYVE